MQKAIYLNRLNAAQAPVVAAIFAEVQNTRMWECNDNGDDASAFEIMPCGTRMVEFVKYEGGSYTSLWYVIELKGGERDGEIEAYFDEQELDGIEITNERTKTKVATCNRLNELKA